MRIYRNGYSSMERGSEGYAFFTSKAAASRAAAAWKSGNADADPEVVLSHLDVPLTRAGILHALFYWASHADNG